MATLCTGPFWANHNQGGQRYAVDHLHPVFKRYEVPAVAATRTKPGRVAMTVHVRITYSHHCFTQSLEKMPDANPDHHYNCTRRPGERRVFCVDRWNETLALPTFIAELRTCYFTRHHNYFVWRSPTNPTLAEVFVYFRLDRRGAFVDLKVESAYPRADADDVRKGARKVSLITLIVNAANGRRTHAPPR